MCYVCISAHLHTPFNFFLLLDKSCYHTDHDDYRIRQNFCQRLILYCDKNFAKFNFTNCASYLPGSSELSSQVIACMLCADACASTHDHAHKIQCVKIFTVQKNSRKKFSTTTCIGEIGENFLLAKFPRMRYFIMLYIVFEL